jgi:membrane fusion protein (multidrug efflux system)
VLEAPQGKMVFVVDEKGLAQPRPVQVGNWAGEEWVITSGLNAGDRVIVDGVMKIRPGAPVTIAQTQPPASGSPPAAAKP